MSHDLLRDIDSKNFDDTIASSQPVLIDFTAVWCAPCRAIAPHLQALAAQYADQVVIGKCDLDSNEDLGARYGVRSLPTLLMFKGGQVVGQLVGAVPRARIADLIERGMNAKPLAATGLSKT